jgi:predicted sulfurtransferase
VKEWFQIDLGYAPPYSTTKDPVTYTGMILTNELERGTHLITPDELEQRRSGDRPLIIIDVRSDEEYAAGHVTGAISIPQATLRQRVGEFVRKWRRRPTATPATAATPLRTFCSTTDSNQCLTFREATRNWKMLRG